MTVFFWKAKHLMKVTVLIITGCTSKGLVLETNIRISNSVALSLCSRLSAMHSVSYGPQYVSPEVALAGGYYYCPHFQMATWRFRKLESWSGWSCDLSPAVCLHHRLCLVAFCSQTYTLLDFSASSVSLLRLLS